MTASNNSLYSLEIISEDKNHEGKLFREHNVDGVNTIGVGKKEPFAIRFKNRSSEMVQVRISVDGTDIISGNLASTEPVGKMWLVKAYDQLTLRAWPEDNRGGARFIFSDEKSSVAANTHGSTAGVGIIAAAVFVEGALKYTAWNSINSGGLLYGMPMRRRGGMTKSCIRAQSANVDYCCDLRSLDISEASLEKKAAVGAGEQVKQAIHNAKGLEQPKFETALTINYEWWDSLQKKLNYCSEPTSPNPFPGDKIGIKLGSTPRQKSTAAKCPFHRSGWIGDDSQYF